jgi:alkanesulfonate monooxygenase SsuD/methylene tetrahydromethanopterin reductase-like flavin-dependent oxidoreductase (luciferase family)
MSSSAPPCSPTSWGRDLRGTRGLGTGPGPGADRDRATHRQDLPRLWRPVLSVWGRTPAALAMTAAPSSGLRRAVRAGPGRQHQSAGGGVPRHRIRAPRRQAARRRDQGPCAAAAQLGHAPVARPLRLGQPPAPEVPIWAAVPGHHTIRVAAELGDGWIPALVARDRLPGWAAQRRQVREAAAPHARPLTVAAGPRLPSTKTPTRPGVSPRAAPLGT